VLKPFEQPLGWKEIYAVASLYRNAFALTGRVGELYPVSGFKNAFFICLSGMVVCLVVSFFLKLKPWSLRSN